MDSLDQSTEVSGTYITTENVNIEVEVGKGIRGLSWVNRRHEPEFL